jgi:hypothetical protein
MLPKVKKKKLINKKELIKAAKIARESFREEVEYLQERRLKSGDSLRSTSYPVS